MSGAATRWRRLQETLETLLGLPAAEREAGLLAHCGDDATLRDELRELLRHREALPERLPGAALADWLEADDPRLDPRRWLGRELGPWRIESLLGRGGSSLVFRAHRRDEFAQQVAIKLLHGAGAPSRRFLRERGFLAALQHPGIARLYDAGRSEDGVPYLVLELVEGRRWDEELRAAQPPLRWRLERFAEVCDAPT